MATVRVSGRLLQLSVCLSVCHVERAHTHTHTHTEPIISISGRGDVTVAAAVWSHVTVTATAAYRSSSLAAQHNNSDRLLNERHRPLSTGSGFVHRKNSWMLHAECRFTKHTHTHTHTHWRLICDRRKVQVLPQRQYLETLIRYLQVFWHSGIPALHY